ncbi:MAG: T9SS type A sorting domain-containing protein [Chitinophagaceae bacterium]|nr:T9SS type A sorting domain-containing protein [Chitinophagaceae bacterium]
MNRPTIINLLKQVCHLLLALAVIGLALKSKAQSCPTAVPVTINTNPNTYYPGLNNPLNAGATSISLGAASSGNTQISGGDLLLIIQMQGAQINSANTTSYGDGVAGGVASGYLSNTELLAGNMEYAVATNTVPLAGGTLSLLHPTTKNYRNANFGIDGQYRFQVIRVGVFYDLTLGSTITAPAWNGTSGGVVVMSVTNNFNFNGQTISAAGAGFRGGAGRQLAGGAGGLNTDITTSSTNNFNASKGEGIAGTPRYLNNNGALLDNGPANEGYANGSYAAGAPGNAGGGGTDGRPSSNDQNSGGGGGANGGTGGRGGNSWQSNLVTGGYGGGIFVERSPSRLAMGGGGGAGTTNNGTGTPGAGFASSGAAGGGIVIIVARTISGTGTINVNGANGYTTVLNDGTGGGGAGGSVLLYANSGHSAITVTANGGAGGTNAGGSTPPEHGPGGGGGGGVVYTNASLNAATTVIGGDAGRTTAGSMYNATAGNAGVLAQNIIINDMPVQLLNCSVLSTDRNKTKRRANEDEKIFSVAVSPNPVRDANAKISFTVNKNSSQTVNLRIVSMNGIVVWQKKVSAREGVNTVSLSDLSGISNGFYFLHYHDGQNTSTSQLVVGR